MKSDLFEQTYQIANKLRGYIPHHVVDVIDGNWGNTRYDKRNAERRHNLWHQLVVWIVAMAAMSGTVYTETKDALVIAIIIAISIALVVLITMGFDWYGTYVIAPKYYHLQNTEREEAKAIRTTPMAKYAAKVLKGNHIGGDIASFRRSKAAEIYKLQNFSRTIDNVVSKLQDCRELTRILLEQPPEEYEESLSKLKDQIDILLLQALTVQQQFDAVWSDVTPQLSNIAEQFIQGVESKEV